MPVAVVTGSGGLIGSGCVRAFAERDFEVIGLDNNMRARFFGPSASTATTSARLEAELDAFTALDLDVRDADGVMDLFARNAGAIDLIVHAAAQPSHDWAGSDPETDFTVNANGTLNLLQAARTHAPDAAFAFLSTNKVYGDRPNLLPLQESATRLDLPKGHRFYDGVDLEMPVDRCTHSLFGVSKLAADLLVQEYGRYFGMPTVCFRGGCLTGPQHAGAELHGFLAYLMKCTVTGRPYTVYGYGGKQVRDNIHVNDVVAAVLEFHASPRTAAVYNLGGGRENSVSVLEAIDLCQRIAGRELVHEFDGRARIGDHRWWITDLEPFRHDYPQWGLTSGVEAMLRDIHAANAERWVADAVPAR